MFRYLLLIPIFWFLTSCDSFSEKEIPLANGGTYKVEIIQDSLPPPNDQYRFPKAWPSPSKFEKRNYINRPYGSDSLDPRWDLTLWVDTTQILSVEEHLLTPPPKPIYIEGTSELNQDAMEKIQNETPIKYFEGYPVYIINSSNDTAYITLVEGGIIFNKEAQLENGEWAHLRGIPFPICPGPGLECSFIEPGQWNASRIVRYYGDFETQMRVTIQIGKHSYHSNTFKGSVYKSQLRAIKN